MSVIHVNFTIPVDDIIDGCLYGLSVISPLLAILAAAYLALFVYVRAYNRHHANLVEECKAGVVYTSIRAVMSETQGWEHHGAKDKYDVDDGVFWHCKRWRQTNGNGVIEFRYDPTTNETISIVTLHDGASYTYAKDSHHSRDKVMFSLIDDLVNYSWN